MLSNTVRFRRIIAGSCLIAAPVFMLVADLLGSRGPTTQNEFLDAIATNPAANEAGIVIAVYGFLLGVPATLGVMHLLRDRAVVLGHIGGALSLLGLISFAFVAGTEYINIAAANPAADRTEILALTDRVGTSIGYNLINSTEILGYLVGTLVLGVALYRAKSLPRIVPLLLITGICLRFFGASYLSTVVTGDVLMLIAYATAGRKILRQTDTEWARPPGSAVTAPTPA